MTLSWADYGTQSISLSINKANGLCCCKEASCDKYLFFGSTTGEIRWFQCQVISSVTTDNAIGGQNTTTYQYGKAKVNIKGRGNLGFGWIEKKDLQSNKITRTEYNQSYPYAAQVVATKEYIGIDEFRMLLNQKINTYRNKSLYNNKVHSLYLYQSQEKSYDFNSSKLLTTVTTNQSNLLLCFWC
jgi:hypothetical protein